MSTFVIKQGDYHRRLALDLSDLSTTGSTGITVRMQAVGGSGTVLNPTGVATTASRVTVTFAAPQLDTPGAYNLEVAISYADGTETVPTQGYVTVLVTERLE